MTLLKNPDIIWGFKTASLAWIDAYYILLLKYLLKLYSKEDEKNAVKKNETLSTSITEELLNYYNNTFKNW